VITVVAPYSSATTATLTAWARSGSGWKAVAGPMLAHIGADGVGQASEAVSRTPAGAYSLTQAFGNQPNNGTRLPYFQAGPDDWWDENPNDSTYNQHVVRATSPGGNSENLSAAGYVYSHAVVINYNTNPVVRGAGSAFFLHVTNGTATAGCVAIPAGSLTTIMQWLNPAQHPVIDIGVG
jgi:L,D-peptidoglycan transpeptidase YkuD (ErfK/YbiS/YcfS/YnhG family)